MFQENNSPVNPTNHSNPQRCLERQSMFATANKQADHSAVTKININRF